MATTPSALPEMRQAGPWARAVESVSIPAEFLAFADAQQRSLGCEHYASTTIRESAIQAFREWPDEERTGHVSAAGHPLPGCGDPQPAVPCGHQSAKHGAFD